MLSRTYSNYLQLDSLLSLQREDSPDYEHDQMYPDFAKTARTVA